MIRRRVFYSFHYKNDNWRASQVRNIKKITGNSVLGDNEWEKVKRSEKRITEWIDSQLKGKSCLVVLIGEKTANRKWINYEIKEAWRGGKGVLGIYINNLKDAKGNKSKKGKNPFSFLHFKNGKKLSGVVKTYTPPYSGSRNVYEFISENIEEWIEEAIEIRKSA